MLNMLKQGQKRIVSWIAIFAILLTTLAPTISHALSLNDSTQNYQELCTAKGLKVIGDNNSPSDNGADIHMQHCAYCSLVADKQFLPTTATLFSLKAIPSHSRYFAEYESPIITAHFQSSHPPQAPPISFFK